MITTKQDPSYKETAIASAHKSVATMKNTFVDGISVLHLKALKIKEANSKIGVDGLSGYQRAARKAAPKVRLTNENMGNWIPRDKQSDFRKYELAVRRFQNKFDLSQLPHIEKRGAPGTPGAHNIDHRFSIQEGFRLNVDPEIIGHICNLVCIPWEHNLSKNKRCDITLEQLRHAIDEYQRSLTDKL